ncbi:MAG TPA: type II toxin-antitoxin system RelE/ParE family toxin [Bellilinea sp.]|nr:type II toxin-antitoxin system RelE/ParE family toxin [Bellilinea sp.]
MTAYTVEFTARAAKVLASLPRQTQHRVVEALGRLSADPRQAPNVKKLAGEEIYRLRVGEHRVLFKIFDDRLLVLVVRVGHRREVYRRM